MHIFVSMVMRCLYQSLGTSISKLTCKLTLVALSGITICTGTTLVSGTVNVCSAMK